MWSASSVIRSRREALGLSLADLAKQLGVHRSFLNLVETGKRQLTPAQIEILSGTLGLPADLLLVGSGRLPEDVEGAIRADAAAAAAAFRQTAEQIAVAYPSAPTAPPPSRANKQVPAVTARCLPERFVVTKTSTSYRAHSYHTKVPPEAIVPFIRALTQPGDTVLDSFCGSGMTGVAALAEGRNALLSDLSPAAVHIARNYTTPCNPDAFEHALERIAEAVEPTMAWLYRPIGSPRRTVEYTTWSDVYTCPSCSGEIVFWDLVRATGKTDGDAITCPHCGRRARKAELIWAGEVPVESHTSSGTNRIDSHPPTAEELALIREADAAPIPYWTPTASFGPEREMWRSAHNAMGIASVAGFFTRRNLHALAALRHAIITRADGRLREALLFAFTACVNRASRRYQWNAKRPTNVMTGTLYISSLRYEWNVWSLFRRKARDVLRYYRAFPKTDAKAEVFQRSATDLGCLADRSVDMVFIDPPFGSNIFYADSSLLWDAWLGALTDEAAEIVVNRHRSKSAGGKTVEDYGSLMTQAFAEAARVLRRGGNCVLAFSNSDDRVWQSIQRAVAEAGFDVDGVHLLDKGQQSIKGVKGVLGKEHVTCLDLVLRLKHKPRAVQFTVPLGPPPHFVDQAIKAALDAGGGRTDEIYSAVVRAIIAANFSVTGVTMPLVAKRCAALGIRDATSRWVGKAQAKSERGSDFMAGYLARSSDLPEGGASPAPERPPQKRAVSGGRNSAFYLAHSYHTKVPPEAIIPFIEHFTRPGDVILDPFGGTGMTGVAAALTGRRAVLNDLSPAAVHLAWNHTRPCDPEALGAAFAAIEARVRLEFDEIYGTKHIDGSWGLAHWTMWSTEHRCPVCCAEFLLWDAIDRSTGRLGRTINCPRCLNEIERKDLETLRSVPAWISYELPDGTRHEKAAAPEDVAHIAAFRREDIDTWYPTTPLGPDREMYIRCALHLQNVRSVADLYTPRNLRALSLLWKEITAVRDERIRRALAFAFTNTAWHGTRMRRFNARGGQRPLTGTLYIPQLSSEANVLEVMRNKIAQLQNYYAAFRPESIEAPALLLGSATALTALEDGSVDYVFTDPPFGSNIFYADCNLVWESWLGRLTDPVKEAVVNRSLPAAKGGKSLMVYADLMSTAMAEMARVLKPGGWATVVFHNTDAAIWKAIRDAASRAGFEFHEAHSLDRKQHSHKGYKGRKGTEDVAHFDVVMNLRKPAAPALRDLANMNSEEIDLDALVSSLAADPTIFKRGLQGVHAEVMRRLASVSSARFVSYADVRRAWARLSSEPSKRRRLA